MPFHNPFIKDGRIVFPEGASLVKHVERWAKVRGDKLGLPGSSTSPPSATASPAC